MANGLSFAVRLAAALAVGYLAGSANGAILLSRLLGRGDIREQGNRNPGTANVGAVLGRGWAALVFLFDGAKGIGPMLLARAIAFPSLSPADTFALAGVAAAAVIGHQLPLWHGFRGGRGIATAVFTFCFFIPVETAASLCAAAVLVKLLRPPTEHPFGRWVPMISAILIPVATLATSRFLDVPLFRYVSIGGHPWFVVVSILAMTVLLLGTNIPIVLEETRRSRAASRD
jgi:acyl-phosphate glycerol 3-phosphate acyltransferase